ncbi:hypothetical protein L195_g051752, partial [Trifolium pratense]
SIHSSNINEQWRAKAVWYGSMASSSEQWSLNEGWQRIARESSGIWPRGKQWRAIASMVAQRSLSESWRPLMSLAV